MSISQVQPSKTRMRIPESLWNKGILYLPRDLNEVYHERLEELSLINEAIRFDGKQGGHGGQSQADTFKHFASLYPNSATRVQCVLLDPHEAFDEISHELTMTLSSHRIALLDLPCGSGAGGIALLATMKELRMEGVVPPTPLTIEIVAADISPSALALYESQIDKLRPRLAESGISVSLECHVWDATKLQCTGDLIDDYLDRDVNEFLVLMANFSGDGKSQFPIFKSSFEYILTRLSSLKIKGVTLLWVEPLSVGGRGFIQLMKGLIASFPRYFTKVKEGEECFSCKYTWWSYVQTKTINSNVAVHDYKRDDKS